MKIQATVYTYDVEIAQLTFNPLFAKCSNVWRTIMNTDSDLFANMMNDQDAWVKFSDVFSLVSGEEEIVYGDVRVVIAQVD